MSQRQQQRKQSVLRFAKGRIPLNNIREEEIQFTVIDGVMNIAVRKNNKIWYLPMSSNAS